LKQLIAALSGLLAFIFLLALLYFPFGRVVIPQIGPFFVGGDSIWEIIRQSAEGTEQDVFINNISDEIIIRRDDRGVLQIKASNWNDVLAALGYASAHDRYYQLSFNNRLIAGQLSEWFGNSYARLDEMMVQLGLDQAAWKWHNNLTPEEYGYIRSYASGVNGYIGGQFKSVKPVEHKILSFPERYFRPVDAVRTMMMHDFLTSFELDDIPIQQMINEHSPKYVSAFYGKENWSDDLLATRGNEALVTALTDWKNNLESDLASLTKLGLKQMRSRSIWLQNGKLERDTDLALSQFQVSAPTTLPNYFMEVHIEMDDREIYGYTIPGFPGLIGGTNGKINWSHQPYFSEDTDITVLGDSSFVTQNYALETREYQRSVRSGKNIRQIQYQWQNRPVMFLEGKAVMIDWPGFDYSSGLKKLKEITELTNSDGAENLSDAVHPLGLLTIQDSEKSQSWIQGAVLKNRKSALGFKKYDQAILIPQVINTETERTVWRTNVTESIEHISTLSLAGMESNSKYHLADLVRGENVSLSQQDLNGIMDHSLTPFKPIEYEILNYLLGEINNPMNNIRTEIERWDFIADQHASMPTFFMNLDRLIKNQYWGNSNSMFSSLYPSTQTWIEIVKGSNPELERFLNRNLPADQNPTLIFGESLEKAFELTVLENGTIDNWSWGQDNTIDLTHIGNNHVFRGFNSDNLPVRGYPGTVYHVDRSLLDSAPVYRFESVLKQDGNLSVRSDFTGGTSGNPYSKFFNFQDIQLNWETAVTTFPFYENSDYTQDEIHLYPAN